MRDPRLAAILRSTDKGGSKMSTTEDNIAAARAFIETTAHGNLDALDAIVSPDYVLHDPAGEEQVRGVDGAKAMVEFYRSAFGLRMTIEEQFGAGDFVATRYTARGTHDEELMGVPATGTSVTVSGICISRFRDGKVVEEWEVWDALGLLRQVGAFAAVS
jgi:steroid delta-isomerase-like uncharacterized protein